MLVWSVYDLLFPFALQALEATTDAMVAAKVVQEAKATAGTVVARATEMITGTTETGTTDEPISTLARYVLGNPMDKRFSVPPTAPLRRNPIIGKVVIRQSDVCLSSKSAVEQDRCVKIGVHNFRCAVVLRPVQEPQKAQSKRFSSECTVDQFAFCVLEISGLSSGHGDKEV